MDMGMDMAMHMLMDMFTDMVIKKQTEVTIPMKQKKLTGGIDSRSIFEFI